MFDHVLGPEDQQSYPLFAAVPASSEEAAECVATLGAWQPCAQVPRTTSQFRHALHSLIKALYKRLFERLVQRINSAGLREGRSRRGRVSFQDLDYVDLWEVNAGDVYKVLIPEACEGPQLVATLCQV